MGNKVNIRGKSKLFEKVSYSIVAIWAALAMIPILLIFITSLTDEGTLLKYGYSFLPHKWSFSAYIYLVNQIGTITRAYGVSFIVTAVGTVLSVLLTAMLAYPLSRKDFKLANILSFFVFFTMLFNGGVVSSYIMWTRVFHINNTIWALILPNYLVTAFNVFLARNYYSMNIPMALIESAKIDGAAEMKIFYKLIFPLSKPVIATIALFTGVTYWNDWSNSIYYITNTKLYSIQYLLMSLMNNIQYLQSGSAGMNIGSAITQMPTTSIRMALAVIAVIPVLIIFPFVQKYLVKGVVMGAVKG